MLYFPCVLGPLTCTFPFTLCHPPQRHIFAVIFVLAFNVHNNLQIPDKELEHRPHKTVQDSESSSQSRASDDEAINHDASHNGQNGKPAPRPRRLTTNDDSNVVLDPKGDKTRSSTSRPCH